MYNVFSFSYPQLETQHTVRGHAGACVCIDFDPTGKYFATGSADALVSLWDLEDLACIRTYSRYVIFNKLTEFNISVKYIFRIENNKSLIISKITNHFDTRLTWKHHVKQKTVQIRFTLRKVYWLIDRRSNLDLYSKRLIYQ